MVHPFPKGPQRQVATGKEMYGHAPGMDAGIGAAGRDQPNRLSGQAGKGALDDLLHGEAVRPAFASRSRRYRQIQESSDFRIRKFRKAKPERPARPASTKRSDGPVIQPGQFSLSPHVLPANGRLRQVHRRGPPGAAAAARAFAPYGATVPAGHHSRGRDRPPGPPRIRPRPPSRSIGMNCRTSKNSRTP